MTGAVKDPRAEHAMVSAVVVSEDLSRATVYVRLITPDAPPARRKEVVRALRGAAGFFRREIGKRLVARKTPEIVFEWDDRVDEALRVESILRELDDKRELRDGAEQAVETDGEAASSSRDEDT